MTFRKTITIFLCIIIICSTLVSCSGKDTPGTVQNTPPAGNNAAAGNIDFEAAYSKHKPTDVMFVSSDGQLSATWDLCYYFICRAIEEIYETTGAYPDLSDLSGTGYRDQIITQASESTLVCLAIEAAAKKAGAVITEDDKASLALNQDLAEEQMGGETAFREYLASNHASYDVYLYLSGIDYLYENTILATYGEGAKLYSDSDTAAFLDGEEYFTVKHIFFSTLKDDGTTPLSENEKLEKRDTAETVHYQLTSYNGSDFDKYFDELMVQYSEDTTALNMYPDGYLFKSGQAYQALEEVAGSLETGKLSGVVETELGYHIVYRLPVNYDIIPQGFAWDVKNTLRSQAARDKFGWYIEELRISLGETASGEFFDLDLAALFK